MFNEWFPTWAGEERNRLIKAVSEIDSDFGTKLQDALVNGGELNGELDEEHKMHFETEVAQSQGNTTEPICNEQENTNAQITAAF